MIDIKKNKYFIASAVLLLLGIIFVGLIWVLPVFLYLAIPFVVAAIITIGFGIKEILGKKHEKIVINPSENNAQSKEKQVEAPASNKEVAPALKENSDRDITVPKQKTAREEYLSFYDEVQKFKKQIKQVLGLEKFSLRRDVYGVSNDKSIMQRILENKTQFLNSNIIAFLTRNNLLQGGTKIQISPAEKLTEGLDETQKEKIVKAQKYERIALLRATRDDIKHPENYSGYIYSNTGKEDNNTETLVELTKTHHAVAAIADLHIYNNPELSGQKFYSSNNMNAQLLEFQYMNDVSRHYSLLHDLVVRNSSEDVLVRNVVTGPAELDNLLNNESFKQKIVMFVYRHPAGNNTNGNKSECYHSSLMIGITDDNNKITKLVNLDVYDSKYFCNFSDLLAKYNFLSRYVISGYTESGQNQNIQTASWNNMNCSIYALEIMSAAIDAVNKNAKQFQDIINQIPSKKYENVTYEANLQPNNPIQQLIKTIFEDNLTIFTKDGKINEEFKTSHCNNIRLNLAKKHLEQQQSGYSLS